MEAYVVETPAGVFIVDHQSNVIEKLIFSSDAGNAAVELKDVQEGKLSQNVIDTLKRAASRHAPLVFQNETLAKAAQEKAGISVAIRSTDTSEHFRKRLGSEWKGRSSWIKKQSLESPLFNTHEAYNKFVRQVTLQLARVEVAHAAAKRDLSAVQAVRAIDDLDKTANLLAGRVREWFGLHFPEMDRIIEKHDTYARLVSKLGNRRNYTYENLIAEGIPKERAQELTDAAKRSMGADVEEIDLIVLQSLCQQLLDLYKFREKSESYVDDALKKVAPNMTSVAGAALSARLISIAGSLDNLAKMPASTLQVLGAEKALFRSLKTGARPPKHGVIFQHTSIHQSPRWQRGKIARALAGKLTIAARIDAFEGEFLGEKLRDGFNRKVEEIKERYKAPPPPGGMKKKELGRKR